MLQTNLHSPQIPLKSSSGVLQVFTFYDDYLSSFYAQNPGLLNSSYDTQLSALYSDGFGVLHVYSPYIAASGITSNWIVANCEPLQKCWAKEHGIRFNDRQWKEDILRAQIAYYAPSILYSLNPLDFDSRFIRSLQKRPELVVGWRAAYIPDWVDWREYDLIVSHLTVCQNLAIKHGARNVGYFHPSIPDCLRTIAIGTPKQFDVVFSGQWTSEHRARNELLTKVAEAAEREGFSLGLFLCSHQQQLPSIVEKFNHGARWGQAMYRALASGRIVINAEIDLAKGEAGNLRLFETTAVGSFLLTEHQHNMERYFVSGRHLETYTTSEHLLEKVRYYLKHPEEREAIAQAGKSHVFDQFNMRTGSQELMSIFSTHIKRKTILGDDMSHGMKAELAINSALNYLRGSKTTQALEVIEGVACEHDSVRDLHHVKALCFLQLGQIDNAILELERELRTFSDNLRARELLRDLNAEKATKAPPSARLDMERSKPDPLVPSIDINEMANQAIAFLQRGDGVGAMRLADKIASLAPQTSGVHYLRVLCLNAVGRHEEALAAAERELLLTPSHQGARSEYENLARALKKQVVPALNPEQRSYSSGLDRNTMKNIQNATHNYTYRGVPMIKNPFDFALYPMLLWNVKPKTIIEIGSKNGGSALWFGDIMDNYGIEGHIYSLDIVQVADVAHKRVTFMEANGRDLGKTLTKEWIDSLPRPLLIIEDADHSYETSIGVLNFFHPHIRGEEYIIIEDGIISDLSNDPNCNSGPHRALKEFISKHPGEYDIDQTYADYFGYNCTWCTNGFLRRKKYPVNQSIPKAFVSDFLRHDPVPYGLESQMSVNERFQLYYAIRCLLPRTEKILRFIEIGSHAGASLKLEYIAAKQDGRHVQGIAIEPQGLPSFYQVVEEIGAHHIKAFSNDAVPQVNEIISKDGVKAEFIMVDGDHSMEGVQRDALDYYQFLTPGGIMIFHDFLPALDSNNKEAIFFHHGGKEPGIRAACLSIMEKHFGAEPVEISLLYPSDPTQTQAHLPVIPGVFSTIRVYRKPM